MQMGYTSPKRRLKQSQRLLHHKMYPSCEGFPRLLRKQARWNWTTDCSTAFEKVKRLIASELVLTHFTPDQPMVLSCDASAYGLGAVLSHNGPGGERPIAFASQTLADSEQKYSPMEKEELALVWGIKWLPLVRDCPDEEIEDCAEYLVRQLEQLPVTVAALREATSKDPVLAKDKVLEELHGGHIRVVKMKALAHSHVLWPGIDWEIEGVASRCKGCRAVRQDSKLIPIHPWEFPEGPWRRVHVDFAGPMEGGGFLLRLSQEMGRSLYPKCLNICQANNCIHTRTSPYHPATNGLAERSVQLLKQALPASQTEAKSLHHRIASFLIHYRNTRRSTTEVSTAQLLMKRDLRSFLYLHDETRCAGKCIQKSESTNELWVAAVERGFVVGDPVMVRDYRPQNPRWQPAVVHAQEGPKSYQVTLPGGGVPWRRHSDQMVHGPEGVTLDQPSTGQPDEEDISTQAPADTILPAPVVESLPNT
eukprot:Em0003g767a